MNYVPLKRYFEGLGKHLLSTFKAWDSISSTQTTVATATKIDKSPKILYFKSDLWKQDLDRGNQYKIRSVDSINVFIKRGNLNTEIYMCRGDTEDNVWHTKRQLYDHKEY